MKNKGKLIISIAGRLTVFLYLFTLLPLLLYIQGSFQDFLDESLSFLLIIYNISTITFAAFGSAYIIILILFGRNTGRSLGIRFSLVFVGILLSAAGFILSQIVLTGLQPV